MKRLIFSFAFITLFTTAGFAQPQVTMNDETGIISITERNDPTGIAARNALSAAQLILTEPRVEGFFVEPLSPEEDRKDRWQRATDTLQSLQTSINDAFVNAHFLLGMALVYSDQMNSPMLTTDEQRAEATQNTVNMLNAFIENGVAANSTFVYMTLGNIYWWNLNNPRRALELFDQCIAINPNEPGYHMMRAQLLFIAGGYTNAACEGLRRALELERDPEMIEMINEMITQWECP